MNDTQSTPPKRTNGNNRRPRRWLPYAGALLLVAVIIVGMWPKPTPVETTRVSIGKLRATVNEEGKTRIRQRYVVSAPVAGQLRRIPFKAGAEITSTQTVVAVIDPVSPALLDVRTRKLAEAGRDSAAAQLERAKTQHKFAASELRRNESLHRDKTVSIQELEQVQLREASAARELAAAEAALRQAEAELLEFSDAGMTNREPVELFAPVTGKVLKVFEESSRAVTVGTPLLEIGDPNDLEVIIEALSRDGAMIKPGTPVELEQWGGAEPLQATVRFVEPAAFTKVSALGVEEQRVYVVADLLTPVAQRGSLGDNFRVEARIITWQNEHALKVPNGAIFRRGEQWHAYVLNNNRAELRPVRIGRASNTETEILEGLKEGDEVILYPGDRIKEGLRVSKVQL
ncbi:MAG TPA: efflux RND transporter periplasmic adaptor subunit [Verrucomicrobiae bacterium]|nr:efflux RND transporter periplasmic adaptor subunit [Verrucomicrobiae bacterium]